MSGLPPREYNAAGQERAYPTFFGYAAFCIETAVRTDDVECAQACVDAGYLNPQCETIDKSMIAYAKSKGAKKVAAWMQKNGYQ